MRLNDDHLGTGFLSTGQLLPALADHGHADAAYRTLLATGVPSWLEMIERGATTVWEWWDGIDDDGHARGSLNHYSKGAVLSFLHSHVAGIRLDPVPDAAAAGYRRVRIAPVPGGGITWAEASLDTPLGRLASSWRIADGWFSLDVEVPPGSIATVELPDGESARGRPGHARRSGIPSPDRARGRAGQNARDGPSATVPAELSRATASP